MTERSCNADKFDNRSKKLTFLASKLHNFHSYFCLKRKYRQLGTHTYPSTKISILRLFYLVYWQNIFFFFLQDHSHTQEYCQHKMNKQQNFILFADGNLMSERDNENTTTFWRASFQHLYERFGWKKCKASEEKQPPCRGKWALF